MCLNDEIISLLTVANAPKKSATIGFDAVIDFISKPVKHVLNGEKVFFETIDEFGAYVSSKKGLSGVIEISTKEVKIGGNMPNQANGLANFGVSVNCIGSMGHPDIHSVFREFSKRCNVYSVCEPRSCTALEFDDGKIMLASVETCELMTFDFLVDAMTFGVFSRLCADPDVLSLVNWSELPHSTSVWRNILEKFVAPSGVDKSKFVLFDITDTSRHTTEKIHEVCSIIFEFTAFRTTVVSLNKQEAFQLLAAFDIAFCNDDANICSVLIKALGVHFVVVHMTECSHGAYVSSQLSASIVPIFVRHSKIEKPVISTGGGDNFNAGLAFSLINGWSFEQAVFFAASVGSFYVGHGFSPNISQISEFLEETKGHVDENKI